MNKVSSGHGASELHRLFKVWYDLDKPPTVREDAARQCMTLLAPLFQMPFRVTRKLGPERVLELQQEVCARLFDPEKRRLAGVEPEAAVGYVRRALKYATIDAIRRLSRCREDLIGDEALERAVEDQTDDAARANPTREGEFEEFAAKMSTIDVKDRVGLLLTLAPDRIPNADWEAVVGGRLQLPARPREALDYDGASRILWPPAEPEDPDARRQRMDRFRKRLRRAVASLTQKKQDPAEEMP